MKITMGDLMNNSPLITPEEWDRIHKYVADDPERVHLDISEEGTMIVYNYGHMGGVMHPRAYLQIMEEDENFDDTMVDILKHVT